MVYFGILFGSGTDRHPYESSRFVQKKGPRDHSREPSGDRTIAAHQAKHMARDMSSDDVARRPKHHDLALEQSRAVRESRDVIVPSTRFSTIGRPHELHDSRPRWFNLLVASKRKTVSEYPPHCLVPLVDAARPDGKHPHVSRNVLLD